MEQEPLNLNEDSELLARLAEAKKNDKIITDQAVYRVLENDGSSLIVKQVGLKASSNEPFQITKEALAAQMTKPDSRLLSRPAEQPESPGKTERTFPRFNIMKVKPGDVLEMADGAHLVVRGWGRKSGEMGYDWFPPGTPPRHGKGEFRLRTKDEWRSYQSRVKTYNGSTLAQEETPPATLEPEKLPAANKPAPRPLATTLPNRPVEPAPPLPRYRGMTKPLSPQDDLEFKSKQRPAARWGDSEAQIASPAVKMKGELKEGPRPASQADELLKNLDTTPPDDLDLQAVSEWEPGVEAPDLDTPEPIKPKRGRPKKPTATPLNLKSPRPETADVLAELQHPPKKEVPLNLKPGQVIWNEQGDEVIVVDIIANPDQNDPNLHPALKDGYAVLGFPPKQGRNRGYVRENVPFSKLEKRQNKIFLTEQIPLVELDEEEAPDNETIGANQPESPRMPEYVDNIEANERLMALREELRDISHGNLGADLAEYWQPIDVEMPKREFYPLPKFVKKSLQKKPWWKRWLGL